MGDKYDRGVCRLILSDDLQEVVSLKKYNHSAFPFRL